MISARRVGRTVPGALLVAFLVPPALAQSAPDDSAAVAAVVSAYHDALAAGDSTGALALLAEDVVILESGGVETLEEYRSGHLRGDMAFAQGIARQRGPLQVTVHGDVAWASSTSVTEGTYRDREINSQGAELMVLARDGNGWKIRAIHWSSRQRRSP